MINKNGRKFWPTAEKLINLTGNWHSKIPLSGLIKSPRDRWNFSWQEDSNDIRSTFVKFCAPRFGYARLRKNSYHPVLFYFRFIPRQISRLFSAAENLECHVYSQYETCKASNFWVNPVSAELFKQWRLTLTCFIIILKVCKSKTISCLVSFSLSSYVVTAK